MATKKKQPTAKEPKSPREDFNEAAFRIVQQATQEPKKEPKRERPSRGR